MATDFCQKCKKAHLGRVCNYDDKGECSETVDVDEPQKPVGEGSTDEGLQNDALTTLLFGRKALTYLAY
jgi:hypothetical protein